MPDTPFSNREIKSMFQNIDSKLDSIEHQTTKTNGRVSSMEDRQDATEQWQSFMKGGLAVLTALVVPIFIAVVLRAI